MQHRIFYHIYPLGLLGARKNNTFNTKPTALLGGLYPWLEHLHDLGCNALYLGPIFESSSHGYDTADYYQVDRRLGTNHSLRDFITKAHKMGVKVILDGVFNHVGRDFRAFKDLQAKGKQSKYEDWFSNVDFTKRSPLGDSFTYDAWNGHYQLVELNLKNREVIEYLFGAVKQWITDYEIDGLRLDAADILDFDFMEELSIFCKKRKSDFWLLGEVVQGDYNHWVNGKILNSVTNYDYHTPFFESFNLCDFDKIASILDRQFGPVGWYKKLSLYSFVDNHDVNRAASSLSKPEHLFPLYLLLFTLPGIPAIYYGSEWGFEGKKQRGSDSALRPKVNLEKPAKLAKHPLLLDAIKRVIAIRKNSDALIQGSYRQLMVSKEQFAYSRRYKNESLIIIVNASQDMETITIPLNQASEEKFTDLLNPGFECTPKNEVLSLEIPSCWGRVLTTGR